MIRRASLLLLSTLSLLTSFAVLWSAPAPIFKGPPKTITNGIGMKLAYIPPGTFLMGSPSSEVDRSKNEGPEHEVRITKAFYLGVYEVTQGEYEQVMGYNPSHFSHNGEGEKEAKYFYKPAGGKDNLGAKDDPKGFPVENVSWEEATKFCEKLSAMKGEREKKRAYRLPTEAEWEYACRGGVKSPFHCGKSLSSNQANFNGDDPYGGAAKGPNLKRTCEVGSYKANGYGLYDMHGNVWEWCGDWWDEKYYADSPKDDPRGPSKGSFRVSRGGSWNYPGRLCRSAIRLWIMPMNRDCTIGFRVALVPLK